MSNLAEQLSKLAREVEITDPIEWEELAVSEETVYDMMATTVLEMVEKIPEEQRQIILMASVTKLLVENFVLNIQKYS